MLHKYNTHADIAFIKKLINEIIKKSTNNPKPEVKYAQVYEIYEKYYLISLKDSLDNLPTALCKNKMDVVDYLGTVPQFFLMTAYLNLGRTKEVIEKYLNYKEYNKICNNLLDEINKYINPKLEGDN